MPGFHFAIEHPIISPAALNSSDLYVHTKASTMNDLPGDGSPPPTDELARDASESGDAAPMTIRLDQFLQTCGVATGGQAKRMVQAGEVLVNEAIETRRRRKLTLGDEVCFDGEIFVVALDDGEDDDEAGESAE